MKSGNLIKQLKIVINDLTIYIYVYIMYVIKWHMYMKLFLTVISLSTVKHFALQVKLSFVSTKSVRDSIIEIWTNRLGLCCDTSFVLFVGAVAINKFKKGINTFKSFYFLFFLNKDIISHSYSLSPIEIIDYSYVSRIILMGSVYLNTKVIQTISIESGTHLLKLTTLCPFCKILRALGSQCCCSI